MLRFAANTTADINIDSLRVAILNYIASKQRNEDLIIRIDDIEKENLTESKEKEILDILDLFGIRYIQVINQSKNFRFHSAMALQLLHEKKAFTCFCSDEWIDKKKQEAKVENKPYIYDDACANLPAELVIDNTNPFCVRIKKATSPIIVNDYINGETIYQSADAESFVILNQDKTPTYNFATAVDDMLSDISLIIQDMNCIDDTHKQDHIRASLGYDKKISYLHLPEMMCQSDKLPSVKSLLEQGYLLSAILNYLLSTLFDTSNTILTIEDAIKSIDLKNISKDSQKFDTDALKNINKEHLKNLDAKELSRYVGFADAEIGELARIYLDEVSTTKELKSKIKPIFEDKIIPKELEADTKIISSIIKEAPFFEEYDDFFKHLQEKLNIEQDKLSKIIRLLLTGKDIGPDLADIYKYLKNYIKGIVK
jgi:glutamyl-tRNA synthetase